jgi:hypothetical protein
MTETISRPPTKAATKRTQGAADSTQGAANQTGAHVYKYAYAEA